MNKLTVIGAGPGNRERMTLEAVSAVEASDIVWCASRNDDLVPAEKRRSLTPFGVAMDGMQAALSEGLKASVLLSGDTGLYSMLSLLKKRFGEENIHVICGVSSVQALCARLAVSWQDAKIISAHGRELAKNALCHYARTNPKTLVLLDGERDPKWVHDALREGGLGELKLFIGERLSYDDECVGPYEERQYDGLSAALIVNDAPEAVRMAIGLSDDSFIRGKTPMTKSEIRAQVIAKLDLSPDSTVWDVGAGTGSVSVECALNCPLGEVYAVERDEDALKLIKQNKEAFHALNLEIVPGSAPEALKTLPVPTHVFLGGTGGETEEILRLLESLDRPIRICATAVTMESISLFSRVLSGYADFSAVQIAVSRLEKLGSYHMVRAQNPVYVFSATMEANK
jgi:precorrin-6y C5,15-methyltransferase (decarboxylating), CbiE subunit/precorrin-6Y C5,15-methyltransferase (decarboxylating), CbiT subunit